MGDFRNLGLFAPEPLTEQHDHTGFSSGKPAMDSWLHELAFHNQSENFSRTFVIRDKNMKVRGFYALCSGMILRKEAPKKIAPHGSPTEIPIALLARFAIAEDLQRQGVGKALLSNALRTAASASQAVAFRAIVVDAIDDEAAAFYKRFGFVETKVSPRKLLITTQNVIASLNSAIGS
ncbi:GNAT family N-acetyltransferase [Notoacmeibacter ruber]|uniref:N-acetyltransferase n=1 Tax=Notoacmeibacter ruber TaxID=2670375 RepID=A0A3L7JCX6_9HYPH|nr:GNAT family N-acetyltransferase [Notoacmeibacter ruber]RLQ88648.1 N-acetyltransferase [Notoacmeibacter ruber]